MIDWSTLFGTLLGIGGILAGQWLEGGQAGQLAQGTAALIVVCGTLGAMLVAYPGEDLRRAFRMIPSIYREVRVDLRPTIAEIIVVAAVARKEGVLAIEGIRGTLKNPLFKKSIKYVIDGFDAATVSQIIDGEIAQEFEKEENAAKVFEGAGGYAPTIGIIGAVLGLIHVLSMLSDPSKIGEGIAVAFVATVYGVGLANLILLPWGNKLKRKAQQRLVAKEVVKLGVAGIQEGLNPHFLQEKLEVFMDERARQLAKGGNGA